MAVFRIVDVEDAKTFLVSCITERQARRAYVEKFPKAFLFSVEKIPLIRPAGGKKIDVAGAEWL